MLSLRKYNPNEDEITHAVHRCNIRSIFLFVASSNIAQRERCETQTNEKLRMVTSGSYYILISSQLYNTPQIMRASGRDHNNAAVNTWMWSAPQ